MTTLTPAKSWEELLGAIARGWCHPENEKKSMDSDLAIAIAEEVKSFISTIIAQAKAERDREIVGIIDNIAETQGKPQEDEFYGVGESELAYKATIFIACQDIKKRILTDLKTNIEGKEL